MKKLYKALPILLLASSLSSCTAGLTNYVDTKNYNNIGVTYSYLGESGVPLFNYKYEVAVTNTGDDYAFICDKQLFIPHSTDYSNQNGRVMSNVLFDQEALAPGASKTYLVYYPEEIQGTEWQTASFAIDDKNVYFTDINFSKNYDNNRLEFKVNGHNFDYSYGVIVNLTYDGVDYDVYSGNVEGILDANENGFTYLLSSTSIDETKLTINSVKSYRGSVDLRQKQKTENMINILATVLFAILLACGIATSIIITKRYKQE